MKPNSITRKPRSIIMTLKSLRLHAGIEESGSFMRYLRAPFWIHRNRKIVFGTSNNEIKFEESGSSCITQMFFFLFCKLETSTYVGKVFQ